MPDGSHDLFASNVDGTDQIRLTNTPPPYNESMPDWSPDGTRIVFTKFTSNGEWNTDADIWIMNADGTNQQRIFSAGYTFRAVWSPDGESIMVPGAGPDGGTGAFVAPDGSNVRSSALPYGDLSPNGTLLAYDSIKNGKGNVMVAASDGTDARDLLPDPAYDEYPRWSPSGDCIALSVFGLEGGTGLFVTDADGRSPRRVVSTPGGASMATWSPDGSTIAYDHMEWETDRWIPHLVVVGADGSNPREVPGTAGAWAPDWSPAQTPSDESAP